MAVLNWVMLVVLGAVFIIAFIVFNLMEKRLNSKLNKKIEERDSLFIELDKLGLSREPPEMLVNKLDSLARRFFERDFGLSQNINYSELSGIFSKNNKKVLSDFADKMTALLYADDHPVTKDMMSEMIFQLETAMNMEREERKKVAQQLKSSS